MMLTAHPLLAEIARTEPGRWLTPEELDGLRADDPFMAPRVDAAAEARRVESTVLEATVETILKKYDFEARHDYGKDKCYRDVGAVYRYAVFAMLMNDRGLLENKLLYWMRSIIQSFQFPSGNESIRMTYRLLRQSANRSLAPEHARLLDPFLAAAEEVLPSP